MVRIAITKFKEYHLSGLDVTIYDKHGKRSRLCVFLCFVPKRVFFCATAVKIEFQIAKNELNIALEVEVYILSLIHISEPTRLLSISYAVFCLKKKKNSLHVSVAPIPL